MKLPFAGQPKQLAIWALVVVAVGYALLNLSIRLMAEGFGPYTQTYIRLMLGFVLLYVLFRRRIRLDVIRRASKRDWILLLLMGTIGYGLAVAFVTLGALNTKLVNVSVLASTIPFFAAIYTYLILRKRTSRHLLLVLLVSFFGAAMVATNTFPPLVTHLGKGEVYVLLSAAGFAWYGVGRKLLSDRLNNSEISVTTMAIAAFSGLVVALYMGESLHPAAFLHPMVLLGLAIGAGFNIIATQFENFAFQHLSVVSGTQILLLENAVAPLFGFFFYQELIGPIEAIGASLIIGMVVLSARYSTD